GIRVFHVTGVQPCALPIYGPRTPHGRGILTGRGFPPAPENASRRADAPPGRPRPDPMTPATLQVSCVQMHWAKPLERNLEQTLRDRKSVVEGRSGTPGAAR